MLRGRRFYTVCGWFLGAAAAVFLYRTEAAAVASGVCQLFSCTQAADVAECSSHATTLAPLNTYPPPPKQSPRNKQVVTDSAADDAPEPGAHAAHLHINHLCGPLE